jgi:hypothetical protein
LSGREDTEPVPSDRDMELERLRSENEELRAGLERRFRWRQVLAWLLVVLTSVSVVTSAVAVWAHQVLFDTDRFMETVEPLLDDPDFYVLIGDRASDSVLEALQVESRIEERLGSLDTFLSESLLDALDVEETARDFLSRVERPSLADFAPSIASALEERIDVRIHSFFNSEAFTSRFPELVRRSHEASIALARDELAELPNVYVQDGEVRLNLMPFIGEALGEVADEIRAVLPDFELPDFVSDRLDEARQQLSDALSASLPEDFGQVTVMSESALSEVQDLATALDRYVWGAVILSLALLVLTLVVSPNRRRTTVHLGLGVFVAVVIATIAVRRLYEAVAAEIVDPRASALAGGVVRDVLSGLRSIELVIAVVAVVVAFIAYLVGRPAWFTRLTAATREWTEPGEGGSRLDRWIAGHAGPLQAAGVVIAVAALFLIGLDLVSIIVIGLVLAAYLWLISAASRRSEEQEATGSPAEPRT